MMKIAIYRHFVWFLLGTLAMPAVATAAAVCDAKSGSTTVALLELYTSEGCSSCPPADRWLAELAGRGFGHDRVVPLALHVDYWNDLGWKDRFAQAAFSRRQYDLAKRTGSRAVYTPELVLNGHEYTHWRWNTFDADLEQINRTAPLADIALKLERTEQTLRINGTASVKRDRVNTGLYIAIYENNLQSNVRAGENNGRKLEHAAVVRRLIGPFPIDRTGHAQRSETIALSAEWKLDDLGVAAFVQDLNNTEVLQALAVGVCQ
ncbi:MAG: DUF1223 domain-containing protein [Gammaproteobacteria bacterium]|nr:DUF1223 domain-containing protein [Gammaproteobacteria bacterium]